MPLCCDVAQLSTNATQLYDNVVGLQVSAIACHRSAVQLWSSAMPFGNAVVRLLRHAMRLHGNATAPRISAMDPRCGVMQFLHHVIAQVRKRIAATGLPYMYTMLQMRTIPKRTAAMARAVLLPTPKISKSSHACASTVRWLSSSFGAIAL